MRGSVRSDSVSGLTLVRRLKCTGKGPAIIARERALDIAHAIYRPDVAEHVPGLANKICDDLSRLDIEAGGKQLPPSLAFVPRLQLEQRLTSYLPDPDAASHCGLKWGIVWC